MKKLLTSLLCCTVLVLVGCENDYTPQDKTNNYQLNEDLKDCSIVELKGYSENDLIVVRCPLSSTTTSYTESCGKNCTRKLNNNLIDENKKKEHAGVAK
ncbi:MAG: hypothetical protein RR959_08840 [Erysipelotrichaceae bacterium]